MPSTSGRSPGGLMFDSPSDFFTVVDFFSLAIAVVAFMFARKAFNQAAQLRARLDAIEAAGLQRRPVPPPLTPLQELEQTLAAAAPTVEQPAAAAAAEQVMPAPGEELVAPQDTDPAAMPPLLPQPEPGFEERIGTRWVVWVGGLTLALGGFFMVRYSIEAGAAGPRGPHPLWRRVAPAPLAPGAWQPRKDSPPPV